ncbi:MAG: phosphate ABC transporter permease PstA [Chloroflexi bacterium]|nr:phosphate ABC transporter permease PstA [Chloroflexota bacterium]
MNLHARKRAGAIFFIASFAATLVGIFALIVLLADVFGDGLARLDWEFITSFPSRRAASAGILSALVGTLWIISLTALFAFPIGVGAAIYLEEYAPKNRLTRLIEINIANLAGVPSVIYGLLGLGVFVRGMMLGRSVLAGALTLALLVLPIVIITAREALRAVPSSLRQAAYAVGATKWQTIWAQVLPVAFPSILTGTILALSRAMGESAPLITIGALTYIAFLPEFSLDGLFSGFTVLPIQIFNWVSRPQKAFHENAAAGIIVLLGVLLAMNALAIFLRNKYQQKANW